MTCKSWRKRGCSRGPEALVLFRSCSRSMSPSTRPEEEEICNHWGGGASEGLNKREPHQVNLSPFSSIPSTLNRLLVHLSRQRAGQREAVHLPCRQWRYGRLLRALYRQVSEHQLAVKGLGATRKLAGLGDETGDMDQHVAQHVWSRSDGWVRGCGGHNVGEGGVCTSAESALQRRHRPRKRLMGHTEGCQGA